MSYDRWLQRAQGGSALLFSVFLSEHLLNTAVASFGENAYNSFQRYFRSYYQHPLLESLLLGSLTVHLSASLLRRALLVARSTRQRGASTTTAGANNAVTANTTTPWTSTLHILTGYFLALIIGGHVYFCRKGVPPEYEGLSFLLRHPSLRWLFTPYFASFAVAGLYHMLIGFPSALRLSGLLSWGAVAPSSTNPTNNNRSSEQRRGLFSFLPTYSSRRVPKWVLGVVLVGSVALLGGVLTMGGHTGWDGQPDNTFSTSAYARENHM